MFKFINRSNPNEDMDYYIVLYLILNIKLTRHNQSYLGSVTKSQQ